MQLFQDSKHLLVLLFVLAGVESFGQHQLFVQVDGLPAAQGQLLYSLYRSGDGFPDDPSKAFKKGAIPVSDRSVRYSIDQLPYGDYALSIIHDRNGNGKLDMNSMGIPTEAIGFSNNVMGAFGPPKFSRARFTVNSTKLELPVIRLRKLP